MGTGETNLSGRKKIGIKNRRPTRSNYEVAIDEYKKFLYDSTHPDNQTMAYNKNLLNTLNKLMVAADERENDNPGEGFYSLIILALRSILHVKDETVKIRAENKNLRIEIKRLKKRYEK